MSVAPTASSPSVSSPTAEKSERLVSLDAYRGLIMLTLAASGFGLATVAKKFPESTAWFYIGFQFDHPEWISQAWVIGCSYWDLIQPSFMFMVGVAMPFSYARRASQGDSWTRQALHALIRSMVLVLLGVFLSSAWAEETNWTLVNVLTQIGLGYFFVFLLLRVPFGGQLVAGSSILICYWLWFVQHPISNADSYADYFVKNANAASEFDKWLLNLFPRSKPFTENAGGYATLNFVPSIVTMLLGAMSGQLLRSRRPPTRKAMILALSGLGCMAAAVLAGYTVSPIVKRIWTPSWVLFSGAYVLWFLAAFYYVVDVLQFKRWTFPLVVFGTNSMLVYMMGQLTRGWTANQLKIHFGQHIFEGTYGPIFQSLAVTVVFWLICLWLYRQRIFLRI